MSDRIVLAGMAFEGRHGVYDWEKTEAQRFGVDVELLLDLQPAALADDLAHTVDYSGVYRTTRQIVESTAFNLIEALAEAIAHEILAGNDLVGEVVVRIRKPDVRLGGPLAYAGVEIRRVRDGSG